MKLQQRHSRLNKFDLHQKSSQKSLSISGCFLTSCSAWAEKIAYRRTTCVMRHLRHMSDKAIRCENFLYYIEHCTRYSLGNPHCMEHITIISSTTICTSFHEIACYFIRTKLDFVHISRTETRAMNSVGDYSSFNFPAYFCEIRVNSFLRIFSTTLHASSASSLSIMNEFCLLPDYPKISASPKPCLRICGRSSARKSEQFAVLGSENIHKD